MSTDTEHVGEETESSFLETLKQWYHLPVIGIVMLFMYWVRVRPQNNFTYEDGTPMLGGIDSYYHWRTIEWTSENYPYTMPFDVFTGFPSGRYVGQFGTLFDQLIVTAAMIVGLGDPSSETLFTVAILSVPVMAALVAIPVFFMGRRLGGTFGGIVSIVILALVPGQFLSRTTVGQLQHHVAEVLFMAIAVLAMMVALRASEREQPIYELLLDKDWGTLKAPTIYSALAGLALALYIWVWPPGVVLVGILAIFFTVQLCLDYVRGVSPDHVAFVGAVSMGVTALITALLIEEWSSSATSFGYVQPTAALLVGVGCVFMAWLARQWNNRDIDRMYYPAAIGGLILVAFLTMALALPELFDTIYDNLARRLFPFGGVDTDATIQEAQRPDDFLSTHVFNEFGAAFYTMLLGIAFLIARPYFDREFRAEYTLVIIWAIFLTSMAATQVRFSYYLVLAVAVLNAVFIADIGRIINLDLEAGLESARQIETYQIIVIGMVVLVVFASIPLAVGGGVWTLTASDPEEDNPGPSPHSDSMIWQPSNEWLAENTPEPGNYGGADNASELDYFGNYDYPDGGDYQYPEGAYGVMSWWDYGHLITTQSERIPHSNPFQQNARSSSAYLTADSEERGEMILDAIRDDADVDWEDVSDEELEAALEEVDEGNEEMRYVMIDGSMAGGKFGAITQWTGPDRQAYSLPADYEEGETITAEDLEDDDFVDETLYGQTMLSQLYFDDAHGMENYRLVHENNIQTTTFISYAIMDGDEVLMDDGQPQMGVNLEYTQALNNELNQIQRQSPYDVETFGGQVGSGVKTFERVDGATITGNIDDDELAGDDSAMITATLELETEGERTVGYAQEADIEDDGSFELTVPYATEEELDVDDGYTESSVEAIEDYNLTVTSTEGGLDYVHQYYGEVEVSETAVVNGEEVDGIELEPAEDDEEGDPADDVEDGEQADDGEAADEGEQADDDEEADDDAEDETADDGDEDETEADGEDETEEDDEEDETAADAE
ncbi:oligosaccharyl transferase, archaeosortase A system-associated [Halostagnicola sp. A-GB9-2]|uniref:oligosaccharyl transferase, archaeosortase A system-associated n=1 Tax=Halostagnicola sp. A-GB9-2 TaxID=3048066 RepID=UPI0024BFE41C|nr:oligosaccharyl transferase, archaeosortase A system-associated [Halostagnicola sp. A-GB9-2]MDJ1430963.1 oligosaccharyl transferase, archaeosortase A system-associated [Halostagnicola sp. A-GB9-2]